jgi:hypothetical protein
VFRELERLPARIAAVICSDKTSVALPAAALCRSAPRSRWRALAKILNATRWLSAALLRHESMGAGASEFQHFLKQDFF